MFLYLSGLLTSFDSFIPFLYKKGLIFSLLNRCFNICSTYSIFCSELEKLKQIFMNNGYPVKLLNHCIKSFLDKINNNATKPLTAPKRILFTSLYHSRGTISSALNWRLLPAACIFKHWFTIMFHLFWYIYAYFYTYIYIFSESYTPLL